MNRLLPIVVVLLLSTLPGRAGELLPLDPRAWDAAKAAHLLRRAGFGGTPQEIARLAAMTPEQAVSQLVDYQNLPALPPADLVPFDRSAPAAARMIEQRARRKTQEFMREVLAFDAQPVHDLVRRGGLVGRMVRTIIERAARIETVAVIGLDHDRRQIMRLRAWWADRMVRTARPLEEKMTLFWHGHFTSGWDKVQDAHLMARQNATLRRHATGDFGALLREIARDPAMLRYLDGEKNVKSHPNENFARELMELFTLGIGHYTEQDVKQAARAFTGWSYGLWGGMPFRFRRWEHDRGQKQFLGRQGRFGGDDILRILLEHPQTARRLARKLLLFFLCPDPEPAWVEALADTLRRERYQLRPALRRLFLSRAFYSEQAIGRQIKSPVELLVGTARLLGSPRLQVEREGMFGLPRLGQNLFQPVNVKGWDGGKSWINTATLLGRYNLAARLVVSTPPANPLLLQLRDRGPQEAVRLLLPRGLDTQRRQRLAQTAGGDPRRLLLLLTSTPEYQLN